jgi:hypothetical protein
MVAICSPAIWLKEAAMPRFPSIGCFATPVPVFAPDDLLAADGWSEFEEDLTRLQAVITDNNIAGSDPTLQVRAEDGVNWTIELGRHSQNDAAGLTASKALPGDRIEVVGRRIHHFGENRIKALCLRIGEVEFNLYPQMPAA